MAKPPKPAVSAISPELLHMQLGHLIADMPRLALSGPIGLTTVQWLARAYALVDATGDADDASSLKRAARDMRDPVWREQEARTITAILHRALAAAERRACTVRQTLDPWG
jgi:hypothetical protein